MEIVDSSKSEAFPIYRVTKSNGEFVDERHDPKFPKDMAIKMYRDMLAMNIVDKILYDSQRQGRISFYMTNFGEEVSFKVEFNV